jgi:hypothetical protein
MNQQVVSRFHNDLLGALLAKVPIDFGSVSESADSSIAALGGQADRVKLERLTELAGTSDELPIAYLAGLQLYEQQVPADVVLAGLSWQAESQGQIVRVVSRTVIYMLILAGVAVAGIAFHQAFVAPTIESFRQDVQLNVSLLESDPTNGALARPRNRLQSISIGTTIVSLAVLSVLALIGPSKLVQRIGGTKYQSDRASLAATRVVRELIAARTGKHQAIQISADLVGGDSIVDRKIRETVQSSDEPLELCIRLDSLAAYFRTSAADRLMVMQSIVPTVMVVLIGGMIALAYGLAVFYPLIDVLKDLASAI